MKLKLNLLHCLLNVYTKFEIDIFKHVEKACKILKNPKCAKIIQKIWFFQKNELMRKVYSRPPMYQFWSIYLDLWDHDSKKWVWPTLGCIVDQSDPILMKLKLYISCHLLNVYAKFQIDMSKHVEKVWKTGTDILMDRRTDGHCHGIIWQFLKWAHKNNICWQHANVWSEPGFVHSPTPVLSPKVHSYGHE